LYDQKKIVDLNNNSSNMTLNLYNKSQFLLILKTSAFLTQIIIIIDIINILFEHHDQDTTFLDVAISSFESNIHMFFKNVILFTFIIFTEFALTLLDQISYNNRKKFQLNSTKNFVQHQAIIIDIMISLTQSFSDFTSISLKNLLETCCYAALNKNIRSTYVDVERKER